MVLKRFLGSVLLVLWLLSRMLGMRFWAYTCMWGRRLSEKDVWQKFNFNNTSNPILTALIMTSFTNWHQYWIIWVKRFCQFQCVNNLPHMNTFVQQMPESTLNYIWRISITNLVTNFLSFALILALHTRLQFTVGRRMILNFQLDRNYERSNVVFPRLSKILPFCECFCWYI